MEGITCGGSGNSDTPCSFPGTTSQPPGHGSTPARGRYGTGAALRRCWRALWLGRPDISDARHRRHGLQPGDLLGVQAAVDGLVPVDDAAGDELRQVHLEGLHAVDLAHRDGVAELAGV